VAPAPVAAPAPKAPPPAPVKLPPPAAPVETGFLSLDTSPWSNVSDGGRPLGQTPLIRVKLSAGPHTLTLTTERGTSRTFTVTIKPGETISKRLGLGAD
jgi:serine/threonine-protein kinase